MCSIKKNKTEGENRVYQEYCESDYFIANNNNKLQCSVCLQIVLSVSKKYNVRNHYSTVHEEKYKKYGIS